MPASGCSSPRISLSNVVLPLPFGPIRPTLSPRRMREEKSCITRCRRNACDTCAVPPPACPNARPPPPRRPTLAEPRARRALAAQRLQAPHAAFVAGAPRFDALADPDLLLRQQLVELGVGTASSASSCRFLLLVGAEVARVTAQLAAVEFDDPGGDVIEKAPVVGDEQHAAGNREQHLPAIRSRRRPDGWSARPAAGRRARAPAPAPARRASSAAGEVRSARRRQPRRDSPCRCGAPGPAIARIEPCVQLVSRSSAPRIVAVGGERAVAW